MAANFLRSIGRTIVGIVESISPTRSNSSISPTRVQREDETREHEIGGLRNFKRSLGIASFDDLALF